MKRLIAFGCSHTYGMGLPDCYLGEEKKFYPGPRPSTYAWPQILSDKLNLLCINKGICAASNFEILDNILNFNYSNDDIVYVAWTVPYRDLLKFKDHNIRIGSFMIDQTFTEDELVKSVIPGLITDNVDSCNIKKLVQEYFSVHDFYDMEYRSWLYQYTAGMFLTSKNINFKFFTTWGWNEDNTHFVNYIKNFNFLTKIKDKDYALDRKHFGTITHQKIAHSFYKD